VRACSVEYIDAEGDLNLETKSSAIPVVEAEKRTFLDVLIHGG
jgi:hypothetical protein